MVKIDYKEQMVFCTVSLLLFSFLPTHPITCTHTPYTHKHAYSIHFMSSCILPALTANPLIVKSVFFPFRVAHW